MAMNLSTVEELGCKFGPVEFIIQADARVSIEKHVDLCYLVNSVLLLLVLEGNYCIAILHNGNFLDELLYCF